MKRKNSRILWGSVMIIIMPIIPMILVSTSSFADNSSEEYDFELTPDNPAFGEAIKISNAVHLDSNRNFISNIYDEAIELDDIWSETIPDAHYLRVMFEENLTSNNDISVFPRIVNGTPRIEVYEFNGSEVIAEFTSIVSNEYNKVFLTQLQGSQDTFDLRILGGDLEFDHIIDPTSGSVSIRIIQSSDDAEEAIDGPFVGDTEIDSSDLEMVEDLDFQEGNQTIGLRFQNVDIPNGAIITNAYIEFEVDEINSVTTNLRIYGEDEDNPATFFNVANNITPRTKTTAFASWDNIPAWDTVSEKQQTIDISNVVKEIVDRSGWVRNNSMVFIINGTGKRVAEAWDGESANAPLLVVNWTENTAPNITSVVLNSTLGTNLTSENLTAYSINVSDPENDSVKTIYNWKKDGSSIALLNMPFEGGSTSTFTKDYSDGLNNGTVNEAIYNSSGGYDGKGAYDFDGSNDYISILDSAMFDLDANENYSWSFWVAPDGFSEFSSIWGQTLQDGNFLIIYAHTTTNTKWGPVTAGISIGWESTNGVDQMYVHTTDNVLTTNGFHHVVVMYDGSKAQASRIAIFVDGSDVTDNGDVNSTGTLGDVTPNNIRIGNNAVFGGEAFDGTIDEVRIYNRSLSAEQVSALYNNRTDLIVSQETSVGDVWQVEATPNDNTVDGTSVLSNNLTITDGDTSPPVITITNPVNTSSINDDPVFLNATTDENADCEYSTNQTFTYGTGTNFTTSGGTTHGTSLGSLAENTYNYYVKCNDTTGNNNTDANQGYVTFTVDRTAPASVTNLANQSSTSSSIYWNWTNPADADFNESIIYISGSNVANTSNNFYNATGLNPNTIYTITVHTKDAAGNVNDTDVNSTASTLVSAAPSIDSVILNSTSGNNLTTDNLTAYPQNVQNLGSGKVIYDWKKDGISTSVLNMPFEGGSNSTFTKDYSDNGNNATGFNGSLWQSDGGHDGFGAYKFDRANDTYFTVPDFNYADNFTITFWFNTSALSGSLWHYVYSHGTWNAVNNVRIYFAESSGELFTQIRDSNDPDISTLSPAGFDDGNWHFYTLTVEKTAGVRLYIDGVLNNSNSTHATDSFNPGTDLFIGGRSDLNTDRHYNGWLDELVVYNRALSLDQIVLLNNSQPNEIHSSETSVDDVWQTCATPNDGFEDGNEVCSNNLTVVSDDPVVSLNSPANSAVLNSSQVTFNCSATDNADLQNMTLYLSESNGSVGSVEYLSNYSFWKYNDSNVYPAADWFNESFDDSSWPSGAARIGVETVAGWLNTTLDGGGDTYPSYYFRTTFNVNSVLDVINMSFNIDYDDGYVVYLNSHEINRSNNTIGVDETDHSALTTATHNWMCDGDTPPTCTPGGNSDPVFPKITLNSTHLSYLNDGENTLAVLIKQRTVASSDSMLMLNLYGYERQYPDLQANETKNISGTSNSSSWTLNLFNGNYIWNCLAYDSSGNSDWGDSNRSLEINANNPPQITQVQPIGAITLTSFSTKTVNILFNVTDADGFGDLNDSEARCALSKAGEVTRNSTSCIAQDQSGNDLVYNCTLEMHFYDAAGLWNITCSAEDLAGNNVSNNTETATVNALNHVAQDSLRINWSGLNPGNNSEESQSPLVFSNGGNQDYSLFNISSQNATFNSNIVPHDRFKVDAESGQTSGQTHLNDSGVNWVEGTLPRCVSPCSSNSTEFAYFYVDTPTGIPTGVYISISEWIISLS